jgi:hypothetical protein
LIGLEGPFCSWLVRLGNDRNLASMVIAHTRALSSLEGCKQRQDSCCDIDANKYKEKGNW